MISFFPFFFLAGASGRYHDNPGLWVYCVPYISYKIAHLDQTNTVDLSKMSLCKQAHSAQHLQWLPGNPTETS